MRRFIKCDVEICTGCGCCALSCSGVHFKKFSYFLSAIRIDSIDEKNLKIRVCQMCVNAPCAEACLSGAIEKYEGLVRINVEKCIGCGKCVNECPFDAIFLISGIKKAFKCDLCGGEPECIKACMHKALRLEVVDK